MKLLECLSVMMVQSEAVRVSVMMVQSEAVRVSVMMV